MVWIYWLSRIVFQLVLLTHTCTRNVNTAECFFNNQTMHAWLMHGTFMVNGIHVACMVRTCFMHEKRPNFSHVPCMEHETCMHIVYGTCMKHAWWSTHEISCGMHETCMKHACFMCSFSSRDTTNIKLCHPALVSNFNCTHYKILELRNTRA